MLPKKPAGPENASHQPDLHSVASRIIKCIWIKVRHVGHFLDIESGNFPPCRENEKRTPQTGHTTPTPCNELLFFLFCSLFSSLFYLSVDSVISSQSHRLKPYFSAVCFAISSSRRVLRRIFPTADWGSKSLNSISLGTL